MALQTLLGMTNVMPESSPSGTGCLAPLTLAVVTTLPLV